ncbi:MAG: hypothetical protein ABUS76_00335 [Candidatus Shikimatogenerans sp. Ttur]|uniref:Uncharacterized protein n=1 Tax=Candidatus Shikimatogenerans sp. Ttur TaxID=3158569 RepID=A0AAU7ZXQ0_9FLAO
MKNKKKILIRYKIINFFIKNKFISKKILIYLKKIFDLERLFSKLLIYNINIKELYNIAISIKYFYFIYKLLNNNINNNFKKIKYKYLYKKIFLKINKIINKNNILKNINYIKKNVSNELDIIKKKYYKYKKKLKKYIILEKKKYNFNFSFNNFLGYYINISKFQKKKKKIPKN